MLGKKCKLLLLLLLFYEREQNKSIDPIQLLPIVFNRQHNFQTHDFSPSYNNDW